MNLFTVVLLCVLLVFFSGVDCRKSNKGTARATPPPLDVSKLPGLEEILKEIGLSNRLRQIVKIGVTDTRLFLRMSNMDFSLMMMEWDDVTEEEIDIFKKKQEELLVIALKPPPPREDTTFLDKRKKLVYGRIYLPDGPQSFEFVTASFGSSQMPIGPHQFIINYQPASSLKVNTLSDIGESVPALDNILTALTPETAGCVPYDRSLSGKILIVRRGLCSFLEKSKLAHASNASAMVVVNSDNSLESISSGYGVVREVQERGQCFL